jgi:hypothetical protein
LGWTTDVEVLVLVTVDVVVLVDVTCWVLVLVVTCVDVVEQIPEVSVVVT